jgi:hypothetical protein
MSEGYYDTSQVCLNGHVINDNFRSRPQHNQNCCNKCGQATIYKCQKCSTDIRGEYHVPNVFGGGFGSTAPKYCHHCGAPYPWSERTIQAASELADLIEELTESERATLKESFPDLIGETPRTELAKIKFKKIMAKTGKEAYDGMKSILVSVLSEAVKKSIFP